MINFSGRVCNFSGISEFDVGSWSYVDNVLNTDSSSSGGGSAKLSTCSKDWLNIYSDVRNVKERKHRGKILDLTATPI